MEGINNKSNPSTFTTTGTPNITATPHSDTMDHIKYVNPNFIENSESSGQVKNVLQKGYPNDVEPKKITSVPNKILPSNLAVALSKSHKKSKEKLPEKTLAEMGYVANEVDGWEKIVQPTKKNLYVMLRDMIINHIKPNIQIRVGGVSFNCHMMVLQCYSEFFMDCNNEIFIQLPEEKITPGAFMMVYDWMLADQPLVQREGILELFTAATFLRIPELVNQCWLCMDDDERFREDTAFLLYLEARKYNLESLEQLMLMRICRFFLTLVASKEFLTLSLKEVCALLSSNTIGVNTEIEIFMSVIRWMSYDWEERSKHLLEVIKCVRFSLMPPWFLVSLTKHSENVKIDRVIAHPEIRKLINDGISFTTTQLYYGDNREEFVHFLERYNLVVPMQRQWIFDKACKYHHSLNCPNMQYITYESFLQYLEMVQTTGKDYWRSMEMAKSQRIKCCTHSDTRKAVEPDFNNQLVDHRDQSVQCESVSKRHQRYDHVRGPLPLKRLPQFCKAICNQRSQLETSAQIGDNRLNNEIFKQDDSYYAVQEENICIVTCTDNLKLLSHLSPLETNLQSKKTLHTNPIRRRNKLQQIPNADDISESYSKYVVYEYHGEGGGDTNDLDNNVNYGQKSYRKDHGGGDSYVDDASSNTTKTNYQMICNNHGTSLLNNTRYPEKGRIFPKIRKNPYNTKNKSKFVSIRDKQESYTSCKNGDFHNCNSSRNAVQPRLVSKAVDSYPLNNEVKSCLKKKHLRYSDMDDGADIPRRSHCNVETDNCDIVDNRNRCKFDSQLKSNQSLDSKCNHVCFKEFSDNDHNDVDIHSGSENDKVKSIYQARNHHSHNVDSSKSFQQGVKHKSMSGMGDSGHDSKYFEGDCNNPEAKSKSTYNTVIDCQKRNTKESHSSGKNNEFNEQNIVDGKIEKTIRHKRKTRTKPEAHNNDNIDAAGTSKRCAKHKVVSEGICSAVADRVNYLKNNDGCIQHSNANNNDASDSSEMEAKANGLIGHRSRSHSRAMNYHSDKVNSVSPHEHNVSPSVDKSYYQKNNDKQNYDDREVIKVSDKDGTSSKSKKYHANNGEASNYSKRVKYRSLSLGSGNYHRHISPLKITDNYLNSMVENSMPITNNNNRSSANCGDNYTTEINDNNCSIDRAKLRADTECKHVCDNHDMKNYSKSCRNFQCKESYHSKDNKADLTASSKIVRNTLEDSNKHTDCLLESNYKQQNYKIILFGGIDPYCAYCQNEKHANDDTNNYTNFRNMHISEVGNIGNQVLMYDMHNLEWRQISCLPLGSRHHHSAVLCNGLIYVIGGTRTALGCSKKSVFEKSVWCFNPQSLKWTLESNLPESRRDFAVIAIDDSVHSQNKHVGNPVKHDVGFYIIGGEGTNSLPLNSVWFYNIRHKTWIKKPSLNVGRYGLAAALVNNEIWVAGGIINYQNTDASNKNCISRTNRKHVVTDAIEIYNLSNNKNNADKWIKSKLHLRGPRVFAKFCKATNDGLYVIGGLGYNERGIFTSLFDVDYLNFKTKEWEQFGNLNWSRHGHDVGTLSDHSFVVVGGVSTMGKYALSSVEAFCTRTRRSNTLAKLPFPLSGGALITLHF